MLLPVEADLIALALTAVSLIGTLVYLVRGGRLLWVVVGGAAMTLVFAVLAYLTIATAARVIRVSGDGAPHATKQMLLFSTTQTLGDTDVTLSSSGVRTVIVNETARPLRIREAVYGVGAAPGPDLVIEPHSVLEYAEHIDLLGPGEPFPTEVSSQSSSTTQRWLTW